MTASPRPNARRVAVNAFLRWEKGNAFAETLVASMARDARLSAADRALAQAIVYGILRNKTWLEHMLHTLRPSPLDRDLRAMALAGLCQMFILRQADYAAVSETVALAPARTRGVVNGMLRQAARQREQFLRELTSLPAAVRYSTPAWLAARWEGMFGLENARALMAWNAEPPAVHARENALKPLDRLPEGLVALPELPGWYRVDGPLPLDDVHAGSLYLADPSTRHCIELLAPQPGERILDACAAPGGKAAAILSATRGKTQLTATDLHEHRLPALRENLECMGASEVDIAAHDWAQPCPEPWKGAFDAVLLDAPCSNTGVIQRRVDVRWRLTPEEISRLAALQARLLAQCSRAVRPGGRLVYSTCSIDGEENRDVVDAFLAAHPDWKLEHNLTVLPHLVHGDGAYAALLSKDPQMTQVTTDRTDCTQMSTISGT